MREAAEAGDDVAVVARPLQRLLVAENLAEGDRALLVFDILRVHEGEIEELAKGRLDLPVVSLLDRPVGSHEGRRVGPIHGLGAAEHVARELVEQKDHRQRALGRQFPFIQVAPGGRFIGEREAVAAASVEGVVLREPAILAGLAPERNHLLRGGEGGLLDGIHLLLSAGRFDRRPRSGRRRPTAPPPALWRPSAPRPVAWSAIFLPAAPCQPGFHGYKRRQKTKRLRLRTVDGNET